MSSITTRGGRRCTRVPKNVNILEVSPTSTSTSTFRISTSTSTSSTSTSTSLASTSTETPSPSPPPFTPAPGIDPTSTSATAVAPRPPPAVENPIQPSSFVPLPTEIFPTTPSSTPIADPTPTTAPAGETPDPIGASAPESSPTSLITATGGIPSTVGTSLLLDLSRTLSPSGQLITGTQGSDGVLDTNVAPTPSIEGQLGLEDPTPSEGNAAVLTGGSRPTNSLESGTSGSGQVTDNAISKEQTIAVAVGVFGGVVVISLIAFIFWLWRSRKRKERRSSILTPLSPGPVFRDEKGPYIINRGSIGPTSYTDKLWTVLGAKYRRLRGRMNDIVIRSGSPSPSVNLDRGNSQFGPPSAMHSRSGSRVGSPPAARNRPADQWGRLTEDENHNWRLRRESGSVSMGNTVFGVAQSTNDRDTERGQVDAANGNRRRSASLGNEQLLLGSLGFDFGMSDPFSDANAVIGEPTRAKPTVVTAAKNPFSDANAIGEAVGAGSRRGPATYVQNVQHSRGHSVHGSISRQPSNSSQRSQRSQRQKDMYRDSNASVESFETRRHKFRSDPFDLDRPDLLQSANSSISITAGGAGRVSRGSSVAMPDKLRQAHVRNDSYSSEYSSGVSIAEWSDPGPDVGPAAVWWNSSTPESTVGRRG
ncbi:hypothetical protein GGS23DRAFT_582958 [Durotheca rogersii]|uniref:uncharacterized protein n=1 Tax=Durotheca rogersii TaxID=419775 RepID=UPI00221EC42F|nr:uncharacterized protein GGS23DRAFT_582958 [Durotheca rogersii]KAI5859912.1 hypothetical protein GGS23DRAFT_582958 [Durotheca rogersii]